MPSSSHAPSCTSLGHEGLFSCCQRKNCQGAPNSFFAIHITAALVLFMTDGMTVSPRARDGGATSSRLGAHPGFLDTQEELALLYLGQLSR